MPIAQADMTPTDFTRARQAMVDGQIKPFSVHDERILTAFRETPREIFVTDAQRSLAYADGDLSMGKGRFLIGPAAYARLLQEADIRADHDVLDAGCLSGYTSCILAQLAASVTAMDDEEWIARARQITPSLQNVIFIEAAHQCDTKTAEAFDVIVINGAVQVIPPQIAMQLKEGGRLATFVRDDRGAGHATLFHKHKNGLHKQVLFDAFAPLFPGFEKPEGFVF